MTRSIPLLAAIACGGGSADTSSLTPCEGAGTPTVVLGSMQGATFVAWTDGADVPLQEVNGETVLAARAVVSGLDATEQLNAVLRVVWDGTDTDDYIGGFVPTCDEATGESVLSLSAELPEPWQSAPDGLFGTSVPVSLVVSDAQGASASVDVEIRPSAP